MACPRCGEFCRCAELRSLASRKLGYAHAEPYQNSEEQFVSTLSTRGDEADDQELAGSTLAASMARHHAPGHMALPEAPATLHSEAESSWDSSHWRQEVTSRLQSYKARRRRRLGDGSLSLNFESTAGNHVFLQSVQQVHREMPASGSEPAATTEWSPLRIQESTAPALSDPEVEQTAGPFRVARTAALEPELGKVIAFPRPPVYPDPSLAAHELAEPVLDSPRILDVPEEVPAAPPLAGIRLEQQARDLPEQLNFALPLQVAPLARRAVAGAVDALIVLLAAAGFTLVVLRTPAAELFADRRAAMMFSVLVPAGLWASYQFLLLAFGGASAGMRVARLELRHFDGVPVRSGLRACRALALLLSCSSAGLGLIWCFVDQDALGWHDRITRTYLAVRARQRSTRKPA